MKLYPTKLKWKKHPIWIEVNDDDGEKVAESMAYSCSLNNPLLTQYETDDQPINLKKKVKTNE